MYPDTPSPWARAAVSGARDLPIWLDDPDRPEASPPLDAEVDCDLCIVGAGFTGLWSAIHAAGSSRSVVVLEGGRIADGASGRNGGFCAASLTHGLLNGMARWPRDMRALHDLGMQNLAAIEEFVTEHGIDCEFTRAGELIVATQPHHLDDIASLARWHAAQGSACHVLDHAELRTRLSSPTLIGALDLPEASALVNPARLAWGLARVARDRGVRLFESTPALSLRREGTGVRVDTPSGTVRARQVILATSAYPPLIKRIRAYVVPVYDYVIVSRPLTDAEVSAIAWDGRQGFSDASNLFHYSRMTKDRRILWGGYDAVYHRGNGFGAEFERDDREFALLAEHFRFAFPQLESITFTHAWGGAIDTCSRFTALWGRAMGGRVGYVTGFTGLGVGSSRFAASTMVDLMAGRQTQATRLRMVTTKPLPFPPEPLRTWGIDATRRSLALADRSRGRRNLWLRTLDRLGLGFDS